MHPVSSIRVLFSNLLYKIALSFVRVAAEEARAPTPPATVCERERVGYKVCCAFS